jgi:hypothetical protein
LDYFISITTWSNMVNKNWIHLSRDTFKSMCKKHIIQSQLQIL